MGHEPIKQEETQLATNSAQKFFEAWGRYDLTAIKTVEAAIIAKTPTVRELVREYGQQPVANYIAGHIIMLLDFVNMRNSMTDEQTRDTAALAMSEFTDITLADIALIFRRAKLGQYGDFYGRLDGVMILKWFSDYRANKCNHRVVF